MSRLRNLPIRLIIVLVIGVPLAICGGIGAAFNYMMGDGMLTLWSPVDAMIVVVDGGAPVALAAGEHKGITLTQGKHKLKAQTFLGTLESEVEITNGFDHFFWGGAKELCYVRANVTDFYYSKSGTSKLKAKFHGDEFVDVSSDYFSPEDMPRTIKSQTIYQVALFDCAVFEKSDLEVLQSAGLAE
ncbi:hypothetical protein LBMAG42_38550 [Deltaproteobacteria bacterium]|nr:hypothetical protein LBMAG42_38550 [Deltaproteobacteria bacterium]